MMIPADFKEEYVHFLSALFTIRNFCMKHIECSKCPLNDFCNNQKKLDKGDLNTPLLLYANAMMNSLNWEDCLE